MGLTDFQKKVFDAVKKIPKGQVTTYKKFAENIGNKNSARAVGNALGKNKDFLKFPCHRVVKINGDIGGYARGAKKKISLLKKERIEIKNGKVAKLKNHFFNLNIVL